MFLITSDEPSISFYGKFMYLIRNRLQSEFPSLNGSRLMSLMVKIWSFYKKTYQWNDALQHYMGLPIDDC